MRDLRRCKPLIGSVVDGKSAEYSFKHALVRDALYQSLLSDARAALHGKIADEIERRSGNRLIEVAEVLAHHYSQTSRAEKAFTYLSMAGSKSLGVYSLEEAATHLTAACFLLDNNPTCASDNQVAEFLVSYAVLLNLNDQVKVAIDVIERYLARINHLGDDARAVIIRFYYLYALIWNGRYRDAVATQRDVSPIADRLGDSRSKAYSLTGGIFASIMFAPKPLDEFERVKREAIKARFRYRRRLYRTLDQDCDRVGRASPRAHDRCARVGSRGDQRWSDVRRPTIHRSWPGRIDLDCTDGRFSYSEALEYSEQSLAVAVISQDRHTASVGKGSALVLLRQTEAGMDLLEEQRRRCLVEGDRYRLVGTDGPTGVCKVLQGNIGAGIRFLEGAILRREKEGYQSTADWYRLFLCEVYLQIIAGNERLPLLGLLKNLPVILKVMVTAPSRIRALIRRVLENPQFHPQGHFVGRAQMTLGLLYKAKKKHALALQHLIEAKRILSPFGQTPMLARLDAALAELG